MAYFFFKSTALRRPLPWLCDIFPWRLTISTQAAAASAPLLPALVPARSIACSTVSQVSTPKVIAQSLESDTSPIPFATCEATYSKCGVPPRMTAPRQTTPESPPCAAILRTSPGRSNAPGTRNTSTSPSGTPWRVSASRAPRSNSSVMKELNREQQIAKRPLGGVRFPSKYRGIDGALYRVRERFLSSEGAADRCPPTARSDGPGLRSGICSTTDRL